MKIGFIDQQFIYFRVHNSSLDFTSTVKSSQLAIDGMDR